METKPRVTLAQYEEMQKRHSAFTPYSVADIIERVIRARKPARTHECSLRLLQRAPIGSVLARELTKNHVKDHVRARLEKVIPATVNQDVHYLAGALAYAGSEWDDCDGITDAAVRAAKPSLVKNGLIGKSTPRDRRPDPAEIKQLTDYFSSPESKHRIDMVQMTLWQLRSSRRISESCRALWTEWDALNHTLLVRKMKDPRKKDKSKLVALPVKAQDMLLDMVWAMNADPTTWHDPEPRIFPYLDKSVGAAYTRAKNALGIKGLRLHDSRRDAGTRLVEDEGFSPAEAICFTGHETVAVFERTYLRMKPGLLKDGPLAKRMGAA